VSDTATAAQTPVIMKCLRRAESMVHLISGVCGGGMMRIIPRITLTLTGAGYHCVTRTFAKFQLAFRQPQTLAELLQTTRPPCLAQEVAALLSFTTLSLFLCAQWLTARLRCLSDRSVALA
jgi:hypothetical protein